MCCTHWGLPCVAAAGRQEQNQGRGRARALQDHLRQAAAHPRQGEEASTTELSCIILCSCGGPVGRARLVRPRAAPPPGWPGTWRPHMPRLQPSGRRPHAGTAPACRHARGRGTCVVWAFWHDGLLTNLPAATRGAEGVAGFAATRSGLGARSARRNNSGLRTSAPPLPARRVSPGLSQRSVQ